MSKIIGIDLGTTNSCVAIMDGAQPKVLENAEGVRTTPSIVAFTESGEKLVGLPAKRQAVTNPENTFFSVKRLIGKSFDDSNLKKDIQGLPYKVIKSDNGTDAWVQSRDKKYSPSQISAFILMKMKETAEKYLGSEVKQAVITVPAYFNDIQRQATISAAELAGLKVSRLINEPTAAALAYGLGQTEDSCFIIFDLGGGTFDVSIVELFDGIIEVRASAGDNYLGGDDFVQLLMKQFWKKNASVFSYIENTIPLDIEIALKAKAQHCLHVLSKESQTTLNFKWKDKEATLDVSQEEFASWSEPLLLRLRRPLERALRDARILPQQVDQIIMVGGATRIPAVRKMVTKLFGRFPSTSVQPDEAIVRGACVQAGLKSKDLSLKEVVLTDVCPFSLGIAVGLDEQFSPILERNTVIPASKVNTYTAMNKGQREINVRIYQGEHRLCKENIFLKEKHCGV